MGGFIGAWMVGLGITTYRSIKYVKAPPGPGRLAVQSGAFVLLAILAQSEQARTVAILTAWGIDIAAFVNLYSNPPQAAGTGLWPPPIAPNTLIFPDGKASYYHPPSQSSSANGKPTGNVGTTGTTGTGTTMV